LPQLGALVIATGLGQSDAAMTLLEVWLAKKVPLLLDTDVLNLVANHQHFSALLANRQAPSVLTPHVGKFPEYL